MLVGLGEQHDPTDEVVDVAEAPRLRAVSEHRHRLPLERLAEEGRDRAPVVRAHPRPVRVEDPDDRGVDALLAVVGERQRLGVALRLVVHPARADRVDIAPVGLRLRVHLGIAVDLARRGEEETRPLPLREPERMMRPVRAGLQRVERQAQVVDGARERGEVVDDVHRLVAHDRLDHVVVDELERVVAQVVDVLERRHHEVVEADHAVAALEERFAEVGAEEACSSGDERGGHCLIVVGRSRPASSTTPRPPLL